MDIYQLRKKAHELLPIVRIGKFGITNPIIQEIKIHLRRKKLIKIKLLKACVEGKDRKILAQELCQKTDAVLVEVTGYTVVLYKGA